MSTESAIPLPSITIVRFQTLFQERAYNIFIIYHYLLVNCSKCLNNYFRAKAAHLSLSTFSSSKSSIVSSVPFSLCWPVTEDTVKGVIFSLIYVFYNSFKTDIINCKLEQCIADSKC